MNMSILEVYDFLFILPLLEISSGFFFFNFTYKIKNVTCLLINT